VPHGADRRGRQIVGWLRFELAGARIGIRERVGRPFRGDRDQAAGPGPDRYIAAYDPRLPAEVRRSGRRRTIRPRLQSVNNTPDNDGPHHSTRANPELRYERPASVDGYVSKRAGSLSASPR
jgi:hypothetical protein